MATDKLFYEYAMRFPNSLAKFIGVEAGDYEAKSITLKETEKRTDFFLISRSGSYIVLVEAQGYEDERLYHRMLSAMMLYSLQNEYTGDMDAAVIFLEESHHRAADLLERQFARSGVLKFSPKTIVLSRLKVDELGKIGDIHLIPFYPLSDISPEEIEKQAPTWAEQIKSEPALPDDELKNLLGLLGGFISHRIKTINEETINQLLGGFNMEEIPVIQEILQRRVHRILLKQITARFGIVPEELREKIEAITDSDELDRIAEALLTIESIDELDELVNGEEQEQE